MEKYGELVKMAAEVMLQQSYLTEQLQWEERIKEEMISQLIRDEMDDLYEERAKRHGLIIDFPGVVVIMEITKGRFSTFSESEWKQEIVTSLHPFISNGEIISTISPSTFILLKKLNVVKEKWHYVDTIQQLKNMSTHLVKTYDRDVKVSIGSAYQSLKEVSHSYITAKKTLQVGKILSPENFLYFYADYTLPVALGALQLTNEEFLKPFQQLLNYGKNGDLLKTLSVFIEENGELNKVASRLFIHRNTLRHRLKRINDISGKDPKKTKELFQLYISMIIYQLQKPPSLCK